jgi:hypothetical protein
MSLLAAVAATGDALPVRSRASGQSGPAAALDHQAIGFEVGLLCSLERVEISLGCFQVLPVDAT